MKLGDFGLARAFGSPEAGRYTSQAKPPLLTYLVADTACYSPSDKASVQARQAFKAYAALCRCSRAGTARQSCSLALSPMAPPSTYGPPAASSQVLLPPF